jgi:hypothetical protein
MMLTLFLSALSQGVIAPPAPDLLYGQRVFPASHFGELWMIDLDRDGVLDALLPGGASYECVWLRGSAGGVFGAPEPLPGLAAQSQFVRGDFDRDGLEDLAGLAENGVYFHRALASGFFAPPQFVSVGGFPIELHAGYFNADAHLDLVVFAAKQYDMRHLSVHFGDGAGGFAPEAVSPIPTTNFNWVRTAVGDLDNDGVADLLVSGGSWSGLRWFRNDGTGQLTLAQTIAGHVDSLPRLADLDGDGWTDLIIAASEFDQFRVHRNVQGVLAAAQSYTFTGSWPFYPRSIEVVDFDSDGRLDVVFGGAGGMHLWRGTGQAAFAFEQRIPELSAISVRVLDLDADGRRDLVWTTPQLGTLSVLHGSAAGFESELWDLGDAAASELVDLDGDGHPELVAFANDTLRVRPGLGAGSFGPPLLTGLPAYLGPWRFVDHDGDGLKDLLALYGSSAYLRLGRAPVGNFESAVTALASGGASEAHSIDWDGDGVRDIVTLNGVAFSLTVLRQLAGGGFATGVNYYLPVALTRGIVGDFDADGREELLAVDSEIGVWTLAPPPAGQAPQAQFAFASNATELRVVRRDSAPQLGVLASSASSHESWFADASGAWSPVWGRARPHNSQIAGLYDLDADGRAELVETVWSSAVRISRGDELGGFGEASLHGQVHPLLKVSAGDLDGDGRVDLVLAMGATDGYNQPPTMRVLSQDRDLPGRYCEGASDVAGCTPRITASGVASAHSANGLEVRLDELGPGTRATLVYGARTTSAPFAGGTLCVAPPWRRLPGLRTPAGAAGACRESLRVDFQRWMQSGADPALLPGVHLVLQGWFDSAGDRGLSDAVDFTVFP